MTRSGQYASEDADGDEDEDAMNRASALDMDEEEELIVIGGAGGVGSIRSGEGATVVPLSIMARNDGGGDQHDGVAGPTLS